MPITSMSRIGPSQCRDDAAAQVAYPEHAMKPLEVLDFVELSPFTRR
jgi:hypothetical protein